MHRMNNSGILPRETAVNCFTYITHANKLSFAPDVKISTTAKMLHDDSPLLKRA